MHRIVEANFLPPPVAEAKEKPRILIIDNNRDFTDSAKLGLERTGRYSVWEENEPARAYQTALRVKPDLILLDIAMPETDGGEVAARIGQHAKKRSRAEIIARNNKERDLRLSDPPPETQEYMEDYIAKFVPRNRVVYHWFDAYDLEEERL